MIGFGELLDSDAKIPERLLGPALLIQEFQSNRPRRLGAAVLTAKFVEPPLDATIKPEVVSMECQNLKIGHGTVEPIGKLDLDTHHTAVNRGLFNDFPPFNETKSLIDTHTTSRDVRGDTHTLQSLKRLSQQVVSALAGAPVGADQEIIGSKPDDLLWLTTLLNALDELGAAVDEDVLIPDGGHTYDTWDNRNGIIIVLVASYRSVRTFGEREHGMFHTCLIILEIPGREIRNEEIKVGMTVFL